MNQSLRVAIAQMSSRSRFQANFPTITQMMQEASDEGAELLVFPECAVSWAKTEITHQEAKSLEQWKGILGELSKTFQVAAVWGGIALRKEDEVFNTTLVFDETGSFLAYYDKIHLFQLFKNGRAILDETKTYQAGEIKPTFFDYRGWRIALSICYDLRFPELYRQLPHCDLILCTAAFTKQTGKAHWEVLLRARAIENQSFVLGVDQCGSNELNGRQAYGHSVAIDPWGEVMVDLKEEEKIEVLTLEKTLLDKYRSSLPALANRRISF